MSKQARKYDFAGWVTKNDVLCSDGVTIKQDAFLQNDGKVVPLVWNHNYNSPNNILGHVKLENRKGGTYGYGFFNETTEGGNAKELVRNGDIVGMSIGAKQIKRSGTNVIHGQIYEVSLVLSGANPGAMIESVMQHAEDGTEEVIVYTGNLLHSADDIIEEPIKETQEEEQMDKFDKLTHAEEAPEERTVREVIETLNDEQLAAVQMLLQAAVEGDDEEPQEEEELKQNVFYGRGTEKGEFLTHADQEAIFKGALEEGPSSFMEYLRANVGDVLKHDDGIPEGARGRDNAVPGVDYGITNIEYLFPEAHNLNPEPLVYRDTQTAYKEILDATKKSPFSRIRTTVANFTEEEARAKGYITGAQKLEQVFPVLKRETTPQTVYKKQRLDRDDIVDITSFDVVRFIHREMRFMLEEELARAILVGDGREITSEDKIKEDKIRPIITDDVFYTLKKTYKDPANFVEAVIKGKIDYKGTGSPKLYIDPILLADIQLLKGTDGRWLSGKIPTVAELATQMGLAGIIPTSFMTSKGAILVNLGDYTIGSTKGGQITNFEDFDIDYNQYKYLIETRLCGALTMPHAAIHFSQSDEEIENGNGDGDEPSET